jgi:ABC-type microcin C transport system permease subunit YejE
MLRFSRGTTEWDYFQIGVYMYILKGSAIRFLTPELQGPIGYDDRLPTIFAFIIYGLRFDVLLTWLTVLHIAYNYLLVKCVKTC